MSFVLESIFITQTLIRICDRRNKCGSQNMMQLNLSINIERLWNNLMQMAAIGATAAGGCNRQALTDADRAGRELFQYWCADAGLKVDVDDVGNMFARREGYDPSLLPVVSGSHLDTQPTGGKFDGVLGVLGALEVVRTLNEAGIVTRHPIEIVNWTNEEGTRFSPAMLASGVFAGVYERSWALERRDNQGYSFGEELARIGFAGTTPARNHNFKAYIELHIEQGPILEAEGVDIGIVTHGQGFYWLDLSFTGRESHSGSTPMNRRYDALNCAAEVIIAAQTIAKQYPPGVGTVGKLAIEPNSRNVVPGQAHFSIDLRHPNPNVLTRMAEDLIAKAEAVAAQTGCSVTHNIVGHFEPVAFDTSCVTLIRRVTEARGLSWMEIVSGAGHDACYVARKAPTAIIFCPCKDGLSHNEAEAISPIWAENGANVLMNTILTLAEVVD